MWPFKKNKDLGMAENIFMYAHIAMTEKILLERYMELKLGKSFSDISQQDKLETLKEVMNTAREKVENLKNGDKDFENFLAFRNMALLELVKDKLDKEIENANPNPRTH